MGGILIDLDGVIYEGEAAVPGAAQTIKLLQKNAIPHLFVTNTTSKPISAILNKLKACGIRTQKEKILTPVVAARHWINAHNCAPAALFVPAMTCEDFGDVERLPSGLVEGAGCQGPPPPLPE